MTAGERTTPRPDTRSLRANHESPQARSRRLCRTWRHPVAQCSSKESEQLVEIERLHEQVWSAHLRRKLRQVVPAGTQNDRDSFLPRIVQHHLVGHADAAEHGHVHVEQDHVGVRMGSKSLEAFLSCTGNLNGMTVRDEQVLKYLCNVEIVVNDENAPHGIRSRGTKRAGAPLSWPTPEPFVDGERTVKLLYSALRGKRPESCDVAPRFGGRCLGRRRCCRSKGRWWRGCASWRRCTRGTKFGDSLAHDSPRVSFASRESKPSNTSPRRAEGGGAGSMAPNVSRSSSAFSQERAVVQMAGPSGCRRLVVLLARYARALPHAERTKRRLGVDFVRTPLGRCLSMNDGEVLVVSAIKRSAHHSRSVADAANHG